MSACFSQAFDEKKEDRRPMDHSLNNVMTFSTCKKELSAPSRDGLLAPVPNKQGEFEDRRIKVDYRNPKFLLQSFTACQLKSRVLPSGIEAVGSGSLVSVDGVTNFLTCAHNLCTMSRYYKRLVKHKDGYVYDARNGKDKWCGLYNLVAKGIRIHRKYNSDPSCGFDIAVCPVVMKDHVNSDKDFFNGIVEDGTWGSAEPKSLKIGMKLEMVGYPAEKKNGYPYYHFGEIRGVKKQSSGGWVLFYSIDSTPGMSGSPIRIIDEGWLKENLPIEDKIKGSVKNMAIAVHTGHDNTVMLNYGTLITPKLKKWIKGIANVGRN